MSNRLDIHNLSSLDLKKSTDELCTMSSRRLFHIFIVWWPKELSRKDLCALGL